MIDDRYGVCEDLFFFPAFLSLFMYGRRFKKQKKKTKKGRTTQKDTTAVASIVRHSTRVAPRHVPVVHAREILFAPFAPNCQRKVLSFALRKRLQNNASKQLMLCQN